MLWLKSMNLQFSRCYIFVRFKNKANVITHYATPRYGFLLTPIRMTLNDPECPIQLKVRCPGGTPDVRIFVAFGADLA